MRLACPTGSVVVRVAVPDADVNNPALVRLPGVPFTGDDPSEVDPLKNVMVPLGPFPPEVVATFAVSVTLVEGVTLVVGETVSVELVLA